MRRLNGIAFGLLLEATLLTHGITLPTVIDGPPRLLVPRVDLTELWFVERRAPCTVGLQAGIVIPVQRYKAPLAPRPRARVSGLGACETSRARRAVGTRAPHIIFRAPHRKLWAHWQARLCIDYSQRSASRRPGPMLRHSVHSSPVASQRGPAANTSTGCARHARATRRRRYSCGSMAARDRPR